MQGFFYICRMIPSNTPPIERLYKPFNIPANVLWYKHDPRFGDMVCMVNRKQFSRALYYAHQYYSGHTPQEGMIGYDLYNRALILSPRMQIIISSFSSS